jgi:23S rRNA U2552 (ribose-2'-O)-methylase RlmE/FtsJ
MLSVARPVFRAPIHKCEHARDDESSALPVSAAMNDLNGQKRRVSLAIQCMGRRWWIAHTTPPGVLPTRARGDPVSRAYYKLREIMLTCALPLPRITAHLCEAPGGFVQALADRWAEDAAAPDEWRWWALSLPDGPAPGIPEDARGHFVLGDVFSDVCDTCPFVGEATMVTADGAIEMNHDLLEELHLPLLRVQTHRALRLLAPGGTFVAKFFEGKLLETRIWLAQLTHCFDEVSIIKPTGSRPTNSERYVVATKCNVHESAQWDWSDEEASLLAVSDMWLQHVGTLLDGMAMQQSLALARVLSKAL